VRWSLKVGREEEWWCDLREVVCNVGAGLTMT
jgi:hypothetical protein